jgi:hypothetical protein
MTQRLGRCPRNLEPEFQTEDGLAPGSFESSSEVHLRRAFSPRIAPVFDRIGGAANRARAPAPRIGETHPFGLLVRPIAVIRHFRSCNLGPWLAVSVPSEKRARAAWRLRSPSEVCGPL